MVSRKNKYLKQVRSEKNVPRYQLRKLSVGVVSVMAGTALYLGTTTTNAHADTVNNADSSISVSVTKNDGSASKTLISASAVPTKNNSSSAMNTTSSAVSSSSSVNSSATSTPISDSSASTPTSASAASASDASISASVTKDNGSSASASISESAAPAFDASISTSVTKDNGSSSDASISTSVTKDDSSSSSASISTSVTKDNGSSSDPLISGSVTSSSNAGSAASSAGNTDQNTSDILSEVAGLYTDDTYQKLADTTTVEDIYNAMNDVVKLTNETAKQDNMKLINEATGLIDQWEVSGPDGTFMIIRYLNNDGKLLVTYTGVEPDSAIGKKLFMFISIVDAQGKELRQIDIMGNTQNKPGTETIQLQAGYSIEMALSDLGNMGMIFPSSLTTPKKNVLYYTVTKDMSIHFKGPVINAPKEVTLTQYDSFDPLKVITATDGNGDPMTITQSDIVSDDVDMSKPGVYHVTYLVKDSNGVSSKQVTVTVNVLARAKPTIKAPKDVTVTQGSTFDPLKVATATDADGNPITITQSNILSDDVNVNKPGTYHVTYVVKDKYGLTSDPVTVTVNVLELAKPTIKAPQEVTVTQGSTFDPLKVATATDADGNPITITQSNILSDDVNVNKPGTYHVTYVVADKYDNISDPVTVTVNVTAAKPTILAPKEVTVKQGSTFDPLKQIVATDADGNTITITQSDIVSDDVNVDKPGTYHVTYVVKDKNGVASDPVTVTVNVLELAKPTIKAPKDVTVTQGSTFDPLKVATATDADGNPITITQSNILSDDVNVNKPGTYHVTYVVKDKYGNVSDPVTVTVNVTAAKPSILAPKEVTVKQGSTFDPLKQIVATDADGNTITITQSDIVSDDVNVDKPGTYHITYVVKDKNGVTSDPVTVTVKVVALAKPTIKAPQEVTVTQGSTFDPLKVATATDADGNPIAITQSNILSDDVNVNKPGTYHVTYVVADKYGNISDPVTVTVKVVTAGKPVITAPQDVTITQGSTFDPLKLITATDANGNPITITQSDILSDSVNVNEPGTYYVVYVVKDKNGVASDPVIVTVNVVARAKPTVKAPQEVTVTQGDSFNPLQQITATDADGNPITITQSDIISNNVNVNEPGTYHVIYVVRDKDGIASDPVTVTVKVVARAKPTVKAPQEVTVTQGSAFDPLKLITATDADGNPITITQNDIISDDVNVNEPGTYHIIYVVRDKYGDASDPVMITVKVVGKTKQGSSLAVTNTGSSNQDGQASGNKVSNLTSSVKKENTNGSMSRVSFRGNSSTQNPNESVDGNTTEKKASLPQTGNEKKGILELGGLGLMDLAAFLGFSRRKKA